MSPKDKLYSDKYKKKIKICFVDKTVFMAINRNIIKTRSALTFFYGLSPDFGFLIWNC